MKVTHVTLTYFQEHGKYYSEGAVDIPWVGNHPVPFHVALRVIIDRLERGERPGLVPGFHFDVLITVYTEFGPLSHLYCRRNVEAKRDLDQLMDGLYGRGE